MKNIENEHQIFYSVWDCFGCMFGRMKHNHAQKKFFEEAAKKQEQEKNKILEDIWGKKWFKNCFTTFINKWKKEKFFQKYLHQEISFDNYLVERIIRKEEFEKDEEFEKLIKNMDYEFKNNKIQKTTYFYKWINEFYFYSPKIIEEKKLWISEKNNKINRKTAQFFCDNFVDTLKSYIEPRYFSAELSNNFELGTWDSSFPILLRIKAPKGTNVVCLNSYNENNNVSKSQNVLIAREFEYKYKKFSIKSDGIREALHIDIEIVRNRNNK